MISSKRTVKYLAKKLSVDPDDILINLWDYRDRFDYLDSVNDVVRQKDVKLAKNISISFKHNNKIENTDVHNVKVVEQKKCVSYNFSSIGKIINPILYITKEEVLKIHEELVKDFSISGDPITPSGVKYADMLESALFHPQTSYGGFLKYPTIESAGAATVYALSQDHAFHNGNKRTALVSLLVFLDRHNIYITCDEHALFKMSLMLADHKMVDKDLLSSDAEVYELTRWISSHSKSIKKGEMLITFKKLLQRLRIFGCFIDHNGKIRRKVEKKSIFGLSYELESKIPTGKPDGDEVDRSLIKKIREDLWLDSKHGYDADMFYGHTNFSVDEFIEKYRNLLRRLSKR